MSDLYYFAIKHTFVLKLKQLQEHTYSGSPSKWKRKATVLQEQVVDQARQLANAARREKRAKLTCQSVVKELAAKNLINAELQSKLNSYGGAYYLFKSSCTVFIFI